MTAPIFLPLEPPPAPAELPAHLVDPFAAPAHPLARRAARALQEALRGGTLPGGLDLAPLEERHGGKMFGILVVAAPDGRVGSLRAFSGTLAGRWLVEGFAPPLFDAAARDAFWPAGQAALRAIDERLGELERAADPGAIRASLDALLARQRAVGGELRARHEAGRRRRHRERARLDADGADAPGREAARAALDAESRAASDERLALGRTQRRERARLEARLAELEAGRAALRRERVARSRDLLDRLLELYRIPNARGERTTLRALFGAAPPPGGAADCAAPKLLALALGLGLRPLALAEFWWGATPLAGDRQREAFYPPCADKCGVILPYMMTGLGSEPWSPAR